MKSPFAIIALAVLSFAPLSCFTVVNSLQVGVRSQYDQRYFNAEVQLDPELLDDWVQMMPFRVSRGGTRESSGGFVDVVQISRMLSFYTSGKVVYYSTIENRNGITRNGKYRLFADTLVVYFNDKTDIEKYL